MRLNTSVAADPIYTHEGGRATPTDAFHELKRSVMTCLLWEDNFYESGSEVAARIAALVPQVEPHVVAGLACEARDAMQLRHVPLLLVAELAKTKGNGPLVATTLYHVIQRADELTEFLAIYWREKRQPLSAGIKRGLAMAFTKFDAYHLAKYNRDGKIKLRDVLFLVHAKPTEAQAEIWKQLVEGTLSPPDTWEVELSAGKDKRETFERLLRERKLGGLAVLRNLRNMQQAGVDESLIRDRLVQGISRALPFRFVTAARYAPTLEDSIEVAMLKAVEELPGLPGRTGLLVDVSSSMDAVLSSKAVTTRADAAAGLAILLREKAERVEIATFSDGLVIVPPRRGFALRDDIKNSQSHGSTYLRRALEALKASHWSGFDRVIVVTDEQSHDGISSPMTGKSYVVNVATNEHGVSYRNGWQHIDGWSEAVVDYIRYQESV